MNDSDFTCRFWGVRGSIPTPMMTAEYRAKLEHVLERALEAGVSSKAEIPGFLDGLPEHLGSVYGGNTSCVEVRVGGYPIIFDCGSGLRPLGLSLMTREFGKGEGTAHIILSHTHWDHMQGFPFFVPGYVPGNTLHICGVHPELEGRFHYQHDFRMFPVGLDIMAATRVFHQWDVGVEYNVGGAVVKNRRQDHPGDSFGYRVEYDGKALIFATDCEYKTLSSKEFAEGWAFLDGADAMIMDAQYTFGDAMVKEDWGHSTAMFGVDMCARAGIGRLYLYHHEPTYTDEKLARLLKKTRRYARRTHSDCDLEVHLAAEGVCFSV